MGFPMTVERVINRSPGLRELAGTFRDDLRRLADDSATLERERMLMQGMVPIEAVAAERARLRAAVEGLRDDDRAASGEPTGEDGWQYVQWLRESAVLALLETDA
jgi:hypothetical protein